MIKIVEMINIDITYGDREVIEHVDSREEARKMAIEKLTQEGDHAFYSPVDKRLIIKSVGGPGEYRLMEKKAFDCYLYFATTGFIY